MAHDWNGWYVNPPPCQVGHAGCFILCPANCVEANGNCSNDNGCAWAQPEFGSVDLPNTFRIHSGSYAQKLFGYGRMFWGGLNRTVDVTPGQLYAFTIHMQAWMCFNFDNCYNGRISDMPTTMHLKVGFDPAAGTRYDSPSIVWSNEGDAFDRYTSFSVEARATGSRASLWVSARPDWGTEHLRINNDLYIDDANLVPINAKIFLPGVLR